MPTEQLHTSHLRKELPFIRRLPVILGLLLVGYLTLKPFYLFPSGGPQIADSIIVLLVILIAFYRDKVDDHLKKYLISLFYFLFYTIIVNSVWALLIFDFQFSARGFLIHPIFYAFNFLIVYIILKLYSVYGDQIIAVLFFGIIISFVVVIIGEVFFADPNFKRETLLFNNPNQIGYWTVLSASMLLIIAQYLKVGIFVQIFISIIPLFLVLLSQGRAALAAILVLIALHFSRKVSHLVIVLAAGAVVFLILGETTTYLEATQRFQTIGEKAHDSLEGRGYYRIWTYPEYLIMGAGEGGVIERWPQDLYAGNEIHSTIGTLVFSYGIVGTALFIASFWQLYRLVGLQLMLYLVPALIYGLTHQGLRFSLFWVLLGIVAIVGLARERRVEKNSAQDEVEKPTLSPPLSTTMSSSKEFRLESKHR